MPQASPGHAAANHDVIPFPAVNSWIRAASQCQFNISPLLTSAGLQVKASGTPCIRREALVKLMQQCISQAAPNHYFPLVLGDLFAFDQLPALETFLTTSPTMREALPALPWVGLALPSVSLRAQENGPLAAIILDIDLPTDNARVLGYFVEALFAGLGKFVRLALGNIGSGNHIELRHDPGPQRLACESHFGVPVRINQTRNAVVFSSRLLDQALPGAVPNLHRLAQQLMEQQLPTTPTEHSVCAMLESMFRHSPELLGQGIDRLAERMNMHPRTLQRRLKDEGQVFGDIQARCRYEIAVNTLKSNSNDIELLSEQLGFSDRHSFTRAFKRWTGLAPSDFRKQHLEQPGSASAV